MNRQTGKQWHTVGAVGRTEHGSCSLKGVLNKCPRTYHRRCRSLARGGEQKRGSRRNRGRARGTLHWLVGHLLLSCMYSAICKMKGGNKQRVIATEAGSPINMTSGRVSRRLCCASTAAVAIVAGRVRLAHACVLRTVYEPTTRKKKTSLFLWPSGRPTSNKCRPRVHD